MNREKVFIFTTGQCRGTPFKNKEIIEISKIEDIARQIGQGEELYELTREVSEEFCYLFHNCEVTQEKIEKIVKELRAGKTLIESWEEGTTGISLDGDFLVLETKAADHDDITGENLRRDISEL